MVNQAQEDADQDEKLSYAYTMNKHGFGMGNEPRELALRKAYTVASEKNENS
ncbi:hypothetical protein [Bacillus wiedmannii]|uniref:hypothetical protein n=1 Tax=Bacillus wiedmannii TaxID=1890302 RepID=UPI001C3F0013|nr:hypothetical protein [Bacillus wiedmannii]